MMLLTCAPNKGLTQSTYLIRGFIEEVLHPWLSKMRRVKILARQRKCPKVRFLTRDSNSFYLLEILIAMYFEMWEPRFDTSLIQTTIHRKVLK